MKTTRLILLLMTVLLSLPTCPAQRRTERIMSQKTNAGGVVGRLRHPRAAHTATLLADGRVLITGGFGADRFALAETEVFSADRMQVKSGPPLRLGRSGHTATRLDDGRVLIVGGYNGGYLDSTEVFDPKKGRFEPGARLTTARSEHVAVKLLTGKVLILGGVGQNWTFLADAEIFDPQTNRFERLGAMNVARESHTATMLCDGTVLITGGHRGRGTAMEVFGSAEIFDPRSHTFELVSPMHRRRHKHDAVRLNDGRVLIVGGADERDAGGRYRSSEVYDPQTRRFETVGELGEGRYKHQGTSILLPDGLVAVTGGGATTEVFDPTTRMFRRFAHDLGVARSFATATLFDDRRILLVGGYADGIRLQSEILVLKFHGGEK